MPLNTSYIVKTIRLLDMEFRIFERACAALGGLERAQLMQEAVLFEAFRLGVRYSAHRPRPGEEPWPYLPYRHGETVTEVRVSISMRITVAELMSIAAEHVKASETLFFSWTRNLTPTGGPMQGLSKMSSEFWALEDFIL